MLAIGWVTQWHFSTFWKTNHSKFWEKKQPSNVKVGKVAVSWKKRVLGRAVGCRRMLPKKKLLEHYLPHTRNLDPLLERSPTSFLLWWWTCIFLITSGKESERIDGNWYLIWMSIYIYIYNESVIFGRSLRTSSDAFSSKLVSTCYGSCTPLFVVMRRYN